MFPMRTRASIEAALPEPLLSHYRNQLSAVREFVGNLEEEAALLRLEAAMRQVFEQSFGLSRLAARALAALAARRPGEDPTMPMIRVVSERCALQRALVAGEWAAAARPLYAAVAEALLAAKNIPDDVIVVYDPTKPVARIPTLPPLHHVDNSLETAGHSRLFAMRWEP